MEFSYMCEAAVKEGCECERDEELVVAEIVLEIALGVITTARLPTPS